MKRRQFVQYLSTTTLGSLLLKPAAGFADYDAFLASPELLKLLDNRQLIVDIGKAYRERHTEENDASMLRRQLTQAASNWGMLSQETLKQRVLADFQHGDIVRLQGWILSITEARQCALYSFFYA